MSIEKRIAKLISKYGRGITYIHNGVPISAVAIMQPLRYKNKMYLDNQYTKVGIMDESSFLFIAPAGLSIDEQSDYVIDGKKRYIFVKTEQVYCFNKPAYTWAILRLRSW